MSIEERIQQLEANSGGFDIGDLLEKHFFQRNGQDPISDGKPTFPSMKARTLACLITFHLFSN